MTSNDLTPASNIVSASPFHVVSWVDVVIDTNPQNKEVYPQGQTGYGDNAVKLYALTNVALARLMNAAGIKQTGSVRIDDGSHPHICAWQFSAEYTQPDSTVLSYSADYELDLRDYIHVGNQQVKGARFEKTLQDERVAILKAENQSISKLWGDNLNKKADELYSGLDESARKRVDDMAEAKALRYIVQMRQFIVQRAQTGAMERVIRKMLNLKSAYSLEELKNPFRVPRARFDWDRLDSAIGKDASQEMKQLQALKLLGISPVEFTQWRQLNAPKQSETDILQSQSAPDTLSADSPSRNGEKRPLVEHSVDGAPLVTSRQTSCKFEFVYRGQTEAVEYTDENASVAEALTKDPLKGWFGNVIVKHFEAQIHYRNHLNAHFGVTSGPSLNWKQLTALADHVVNGVAYPAEYNPTQEKPKAKSNGKTTSMPDGLADLLDKIKTEHKVAELPEQAVQDAIASIRQGIYNLSIKDDVTVLTNTIVEALPK